MVGVQIFNKCKKVSLLDRRHPFGTNETAARGRRPGKESATNSGSSIASKEKVVIKKAVRTNESKLAGDVTEIASRDLMFVSIMKTISNSVMVLEKQYREKIFPMGLTVFLEELTLSAFLTRMVS